MNDKVLIKLNVPELDDTFELFVPVNETVWKIERMINKALFEITNYLFPLESNTLLMNSKSGYIYKDDEVLFDTDIRNTTELVLVII